MVLDMEPNLIKEAWRNIGQFLWLVLNPSMMPTLLLDSWSRQFQAREACYKT